MARQRFTDKLESFLEHPAWVILDRVAPTTKQTRLTWSKLGQKKEGEPEHKLKKKYRLDRDEFGNCLIHYLAKYSLLQSHPICLCPEDAMLTGAFKRLPAHLAAQFGSKPNNLAQLMDNMDNLNQQDVFGKTVLQFAILNNNTQTRIHFCKMIVHHTKHDQTSTATKIKQKREDNAEAPIKTSSLYHAINLASKNNETSVLDILLNEGVKDVYEKISNIQLVQNTIQQRGTFSNILHLAIKDQNEDCVNDILQHCNTTFLPRKEPLLKQILTEFDEHGNTPLHIAIAKKNKTLVQVILNKLLETFREEKKNLIAEKRKKRNSRPLLSEPRIASINANNAKEDEIDQKINKLTIDKKILNFAAMKSSKEIFDLIYEAVKTENDESDLEAINSAFCDAIKENNRELTEHLMLEKNANINTEIEGSRRAIQVAADKGYTDIVKILLDNEQDLDLRSVILNDQESIKNNILHLSLDSKRPDNIGLLLDIFEKNEFVKLKDSQVCAFLTNIDDRKNTPIHKACYLDLKTSTFKKLIAFYREKQINLARLTNIDGHTPLHVATINNKLNYVNIIKDEFVQIMNDVEAFKDLVKVADVHNQTVLHAAAKKKEKDILNILINFYDDNSDTLDRKQFHKAALFGAVRYLQDLEDFESDRTGIDLTDQEGKTPLTIAVENGHDQVVSLLLKLGADVTIKVHGKTALQHAIDKNQKDCIQAIVRSTSWVKALRTSETVETLGVPRLQTPTRLLIKTYPGIAKIVLDRCLEKNINIKEQTETSKFRFEFLEDTFQFQLLKDKERGNKKFYKHVEEISDRVKKEKIKKNKVKELKEDEYCFSDAYTYFYVDNHPLIAINDFKQQNLLDHRVTKSLINQKWNDFGWKYYYSNFLFYFLFVIFLTIYFMTSMPQNPLKYPKLFRCHSDYFGLPENNFQNRNQTYIVPEELLKAHPGFLNNISIGLIVVCVIIRLIAVIIGHEARNLLRILTRIVDFVWSVLTCKKEIRFWEFDKDKRSGQLKSVKSYTRKLFAVDNLLYFLMKREWALIFDITVYFSALLVSDPFSFFTREFHFQGGTTVYVKSCFIWQIMAVTITLAWINLLTYMRQFAMIGKYIIILNDIIYTFISFIIVFLIFLLAFSFGFYSIFTSIEDTFDTFPHSMMKTLIMMSGEFDYGGLFYPAGTAPFPGLGYVFFILFFILLSVILINLLVGLTVNDVETFVEIANLKKYSMRLKFVLNLEHLGRYTTFYTRFLKSGQRFPPVTYTKIKRLYQDHNSTKMWKQVLSEQVHEDKTKDLLELKSKSIEIENKIRSFEKQMKDRTEEIADNQNHLRIQMETKMKKMENKLESFIVDFSVNDTARDKRQQENDRNKEEQLTIKLQATEARINEQLTTKFQATEARIDENIQDRLETRDRVLEEKRKSRDELLQTRLQKTEDRIENIEGNIAEILRILQNQRVERAERSFFAKSSPTASSSSSSSNEGSDQETVRAEPIRVRQRKETKGEIRISDKIVI